MFRRKDVLRRLPNCNTAVSVRQVWSEAACVLSSHSLQTQAKRNEGCDRQFALVHATFQRCTLKVTNTQEHKVWKRSHYNIREIIVQNLQLCSLRLQTTDMCVAAWQSYS